MLDVGEVVGDRYQVLSRIAGGAMGEVYCVVHRTLNVRYALKVMRPVADAKRTQAILARAKQEGLVQARLSHPNVLRLMDAFEVHGTPGLLLEWIDGPTLHDLVSQHHPLTVDLVEEIGAGLIRGLRAAHQLGILHRDLKPENIMMAQADNTWVPKIADFGIAKALHQEPGTGVSTAIGAVFGTPQYMSPEQARSTKNVNTKADIFSLGCVLYEVLCGRRAFEGRSLVEIQSRIMARQFTPIRALRPDAPLRFRNAIDEAMSPDVSRRTATCDDLLLTWTTRSLETQEADHGELVDGGPKTGASTMVPDSFDD